MDLVGIGIDVVEVRRIESSIKEFGEKFLSRIFTEKERLYCESKKTPVIHYAARFAAKEAVSKAFGVGIGSKLSWLDIEVDKKESGEPELNMLNKGAVFASVVGVNEIKISLSHTENYAAANAIVLKWPVQRN